MPPKTVLEAFGRLRAIPYLSQPATRPYRYQGRLNNEVKVAFGLGNLRWKPGQLRSAYGAICYQLFKPKVMSEDIFLARILGHKLLRCGPLGRTEVTRISMSCLDFAGATLDTPMEFSEDVWADWRATRQEQFGQDWPTVTLILNELAHYGIHLLDVSPSNIRVR